MDPWGVSWGDPSAWGTSWQVAEGSPPARRTSLIDLSGDLALCDGDRELVDMAGDLDLAD